MGKFTVDAPKWRVIKALEILGFEILREKRTYFNGPPKPGRHQGSYDCPESSKYQSLHLRTICGQAGISRDEFLQAFARA